MLDYNRVSTLEESFKYSIKLGIFPARAEADGSVIRGNVETSAYPPGSSV